MSEEKLCVDFLRLHKLLELPSDVQIKRVAMELATFITATPDEDGNIGKVVRTKGGALAVYLEECPDTFESDVMYRLQKSIAAKRKVDDDRQDPRPQPARTRGA